MKISNSIAIPLLNILC